MIDAAFFDTKPYDRESFTSPIRTEKIRWRFFDFRLDASTALSAMGVTAVCVFVNDKVDRLRLAALQKAGVKLIALRCAGFNNVDLRAAQELGLQVVRVPAYSPHAVAEHAVALLLTLNRKIHRAYNRVREHNFSLSGLVGFDLHGKTIGIVGTGKIGQCAAEIFRGFGCNVLASDPKPNAEWAVSRGVVYTSLERLLAESDVVSLHAPLFPETRHVLNAKTLALMKPAAYVINTSRGQLIDTAALVAALKAGRLGGVALDVYEEEQGIFFEDHSNRPLTDEVLLRLLTFSNVLITSHQGFLTTEALAEIARVTTENLERFAHGEEFLPGTLVT